MAAGPFERNGVRPRMLDLARTARYEACQAVITYLGQEGCLDEVAMTAGMSAAGRDTWVKAITEVFSQAQKEVTKEALAELAEWEELALLLRCRKCGADEEEPCRDLRLNVIRHNKHPHQERMDDMEAS